MITVDEFVTEMTTTQWEEFLKREKKGRESGTWEGDADRKKTFEREQKAK